MEREVEQSDVYSNGHYKCVVVIPKAVNPISGENYIVYKTLKESSTTMFVEQKEVFENMYTFEYNIHEKLEGKCQK